MSVQTFPRLRCVCLTSYSADQSAPMMLWRAISRHVVGSVGLVLVEASNKLKMVAEDAAQHGTSQAHELYNQVIEIKTFLSTEC